MDTDRKKAKEQVKALPFNEKIKYYWSYYRNHLIIGLIILVIIVYSVYEIATKPQYDLNIACYFSSAIAEETVNDLVEIAKENIDDITGDGEVLVEHVTNYYAADSYSEQNQAVLTKFMAELSAGDAFVYIFDESFLNFIKDGYGDCFEQVIDLNSIPELKEKLDLSDEQKICWATKALYEQEKDKEKRVSAHKNAVKVSQYFSSIFK